MKATTKAVKKNARAKRTQLNIKISETLKASLQKFCDKKNISKTDFVESLISASLKKN